MGCHALLQGIFPTQGSNPGLPHCRKILYHVSHLGRPIIPLLCFKYNACVHAKLLQSCLTLRDPMDCSPPGKSAGVGCHCLLLFGMVLLSNFMYFRLTWKNSLFINNLLILLIFCFTVPAFLLYHSLGYAQFAEYISVKMTI